MATHSSVLAWRIPGTGSLVGCHLWGRTESDTTEATQQQQQQGDEKKTYKKRAQNWSGGFSLGLLGWPTHMPRVCIFLYFLNKTEL